MNSTLLPIPGWTAASPQVLEPGLLIVREPEAEPTDAPLNRWMVVLEGSIVEEVFDLDGESRTVEHKPGHAAPTPASRISRVAGLPTGSALLYIAPTYTPVPRVWGFYRWHGGTSDDSIILFHRFHTEPDYRQLRYLSPKEAGANDAFYGRSPKPRKAYGHLDIFDLDVVDQLAYYEGYEAETDRKDWGAQP